MGEFFAPREVANLIVGVLQPEPSESVYDPTCGSGGMLVSTINNVREQGKDHRTLRVYGQEINLTTSSIARMNLFLHEIEGFDIKRGDTLRAPAFKDNSGAIRQFDAVIANPPFFLQASVPGSSRVQASRRLTSPLCRRRISSSTGAAPRPAKPPLTVVRRHASDSDRGRAPERAPARSATRIEPRPDCRIVTPSRKRFGNMSGGGRR